MPESQPPPREEPSRPSTFHELQGRLAELFERIESDRDWEHTAVIVPSLSFHQEELAKIPGVASYEERLLFYLTRLRHPAARVAYVTSQPVHTDIIDYYLHHLVGVHASHARSRLHLLCLYDGSPKPLTQKLLERPRALERLRRWVGPPERAFLTCFYSTPLERRLAESLGVALNGVDPALQPLGTKSGSRRIFREAGVDLPEGFEELRTQRQFVDALIELEERRPGLRRAVLKLNDSFSGSGNAIAVYPERWPRDPGAQRAAARRMIHELEWSVDGENVGDYLRKMEEMGGIVEEWVEAREVRSPSVQMRIHPDGQVLLVSSHDQVLKGATGQSYFGCRFPASTDYRLRIQEEAAKIGRALRDRGVISRFAIDFLATRDAPEEGWRIQAVEINLRMGGTTPPFMALQFLTGGDLDPASGEFLAPRGEPKYYYATDVLASPAYKGLLPEDFLDILVRDGLNFNTASGKGVLFHMIGALSEHGKVGVTCIGDSREEADSLYQRTVEILDHETGAAQASAPAPLDERRIGPVE